MRFPSILSSRSFHVSLLMTLFCLVGCEDKSPPKWCSDCELAAKATGGSEVTLSWGAATDDREVNSYRVLVDEVEHMTVHGSQTSLPVEALTEERSYRFSVVALDKAGNSSEPLHAEARTLDKRGPVWNAGVVRFSKHVDGVMVAWPEAKDGAGVSEYKMKSSAGEESIGMKRMHKISLELATKGVSIVALDGNGNKSSPLRGAFAENAPTLAPVAEAAPQIGAAPRNTKPADLMITPKVQAQIRQPLSPRVMEMLSKRGLTNPKLKSVLEVPMKLNVPE